MNRESNRDASREVSSEISGQQVAEGTLRNDSATSTALSLLDVFRVSRAGLIVSHLWVYVVPAIHGSSDFGWNFWVGLAYITVPLGLLIYGWNDFFDWDVDHISPRKKGGGSIAYGPSLQQEQLASLPRIIALAQLPFLLTWALTGEYRLIVWLGLMTFGNALYNGPGVRLSRIPVLAELTATGIYLLIAWLGVLIHSPGMPAWIWIFAALSILNFQIMGALVDVAEDARVGKRTFAVAFGKTASYAAVIIILLSKAAVTYVFTGHLLATGVVLFGVVLVAGSFTIGRVGRTSTAYNSFIVLDWTWLALMFLR